MWFHNISYLPLSFCHSTHAKHHNEWRRFYANLLPHWRYWSYWPISCAPWWKSSAVRTSNQEQSCTCCLLFQNNNSERQPARMHKTNISDIKKLRSGALWSSLDMQHRGNGEACNHTSQDASWHLPPTASGQGQASHGSWDTRYKWHRKRSRWSWWRDHGHLSAGLRFRTQPGKDITGRQPQISVNFEPLKFCDTLLNRIISYYHYGGAKSTLNIY